VCRCERPHHFILARKNKGSCMNRDTDCNGIDTGSSVEPPAGVLTGWEENTIKESGDHDFCLFLN